MTSACRRPATLLWIALIACQALAAPPHRLRNNDDAQWRYYGGDAGGTRHAASRQITPGNVDRLKIAWTYRTGEVPPPNTHVNFQVVPLKIGDALYLCTPNNVVIALDADTGKQIWKTAPKINSEGKLARVCRGLAS